MGASLPPMAWKALPDGDPRKVRPPVVAMVFPANVRDAVARWDKYAKIDVELIEKTFSDYDAMIAYRDSLLHRH